MHNIYVCLHIIVFNCEECIQLANSNGKMHVQVRYIMVEVQDLIKHNFTCHKLI